MFVESTYLGDIVKYEADKNYSREKVTVLAGSGSARVLKLGMVVGRITVGAAIGAAVAGNAANTGTITGSPTVGIGAKPGVYRAVCIEPATNSGKFLVVDPDGIPVGVATVGTAFTGGGLTFTISDGATDFTAGESFTVTVAPGSGKVLQIDPASTTGAGAAYGILVADVTARDGADAAGVVIVRQAIVDKTFLVWPVGFTEDQKNAALAQLERQGILARTSV